MNRLTTGSILLVILLPACSARSGGQDDTFADPGVDTDIDTSVPPSDWPEPNDWSWNGSWVPAPGDFPIDCLLDDEYFDGHPGGDGEATPILPPGQWDWDDGNDDLANWRNFASSIGSFVQLYDGEDRHHGWTLAPVSPGAVDYAGAAAYFEGSCGADVIDLGAAGTIHSFASGNLGDGPDVLVFGESWSLDFRTGSSETGHERDDDLVMAGCGDNPDGSFDMMTTTVHTGPGSDWVFIDDISRAAVDLGNGLGGRTDALDEHDADDIVVLGGNTHDFRVFGGIGNDVVFWSIDDNVQTTTWLGPNFFGGGGWADALWDDPGIDRLVLDVPVDAPLSDTTPLAPGSVLVRATDGDLVDDEPTAGDPFAHYCIECGTGPGGRKTVILQYISADSSVDTGYFFVTAFEQLQIGTGPGARVYELDDVLGIATEIDDAEPLDPPAWPTHLCL